MGHSTITKRILAGLGVLGLAGCLGVASASAQDQASPAQVPNDPSQGQMAPGDQQGGAPLAAPDQQNAPAPMLPATLTLPQGTVVVVRTTGWISSDKNQPGDRFSATLEQPLIGNGWVVARRGQTVTGRVSVAQKAGHGNSSSQLGLELSELTLVDGQVLPVNTQLIQNAGVRPRANSADRDVATVGTTTAVGAVIGGVIGGGTGAAVGAGIGAVAGLGVLSTHGGPTVIYPETVLSFRLGAPLSISTEGSQVAFQPVSQEDYAPPAPTSRDQDAYGGPRRYALAAPYGPYYYPYGPYNYWYPGPAYFGFGFYGPAFRGPVFRGGFRR